MLVGLNKGRIVSKYIIAVVFLLGLMQGKTEALTWEKDGVILQSLLIKETVLHFTKYKKCSDTKDDKKRLACFDSLTKYTEEREKKYDNLGKLDKLSEDSEKEAEKQLEDMLKELNKALGLNNKP